VSQASTTSIRLIVNADDFGLTAGVNRGIGELAGVGALTSATLMANGSALVDAIRTAQDLPALGVGCHVVLVDGKPVSPAESVPSLLGRGESLRDSLLRFATDLQRGLISEKEIEAEATAQIRRLQSAGVRVTHVDTHKHTHLFPRVARPLMRAAIRCGVPAIRNPFEQAWSARLTRGAFLRKFEVAVLRNFQQRFHLLRRAAALRTTDGSIGVSATGHLDDAALALLLRDAPGGSWELVCHPGYNDADLGAVKTRLRKTRDVERRALHRLIPEAVQSGRVELIGFGDL
jgi:predicted glycoside hydrolase/deacetylase ChbG (UPF0249 family)